MRMSVEAVFESPTSPGISAPRPLWAEALAAILIVVTPAAAFVPAVNLGVEFLAALAALDFVSRRRWVLLAPALLLATVLSTAIQPLFMAALAMKTLLSATAFGYVSVRFVSPRVGLWIAAIVASALVALAFAVGGEALFGGFDLVARGTRQMFLSGAALGSYNEETRLMMSESVDTMLAFIRWVLPSWFLISALAVVALAWTVAPLLRRRGEVVGIVSAPFTMWRVDFMGLYVLAVLIAFRSAAWFAHTKLALQIADNALFALAFVFSVAGLAVSNYLLRRLNAAWYVKLAFYIPIVLLVHYGLVFLAVIGVLDSFFDYRARLERAIAESANR